MYNSILRKYPRQKFTRFGVLALLFSREFVTARDGHKVVVDWLIPENANKMTPVIVVVPGICITFLFSHVWNRQHKRGTLYSAFLKSR
jgi:hypothetical protein